jgi:uncharacterized protein (DUF2252 family)
MTNVNDPKLRKAPLPEMTYTLKVEERLAKGKALRNVAARTAQREWNSPADRADPIDLLIENSRGRLEDLLPIRYGRMLVSPFTFYRGAAAIMAYDLSHTPCTGLTLLANGDCHLLNFGGFATAERKLIFDINDFDEVSLAPWEWDVKRLVTSFVIAGQSNGYDLIDCKEVGWQAARAYRQRMAEYSLMPALQVWNDTFDLETALDEISDKATRRFYSKKLTKATEQNPHEKEFAKLAIIAEGRPRILDQPPLIFHYGDARDEEVLETATTTLSEYKKNVNWGVSVLLNRFKVVDAALKVVGVGSVGTVCGIILLMSSLGDHLFLQFKEARQSVLEPYCGASPFEHAGRRVVIGQRLMQAAGDMFLGWTTSIGARKREIYIRQLSDAKVKPSIEIMKPNTLKDYARLCGQVLARAHARSGDPAVLTGYMGKSTAFEDSLAEFGAAYATQNEHDHACLVDAVRAGRIEASFTEA